MNKRTIAILGATGSIGTQALDIVRRHPDRFSAVALTAYSSAEKLFALAREFRPQVAGLVVEPEAIPEDLKHIEWIFGEDVAERSIAMTKPDDALMAVVGIGLFIGMGRGERRREELLTWGTQVDATVEKVAQNRLLQVNGRNPWYVEVSCRHPVTRENVQLRSHYVFRLTVQPGDHVRVAFDPMDERKYAVILPEGKAKA